MHSTNIFHVTTFLMVFYVTIMANIYFSQWNWIDLDNVL